MGLLTTSTGQRMLGGAARMMAAELLFPALALVTAGFLTRHLGPHGYGVLALTLSVVIWCENAIAAFFSRTAIRLVGQSSDWKSLSAHLIRRTAMTGVAVSILVWLLAEPISLLLGEAGLARYLRLAAIDIPILCTAVACRAVLVGTSQFHGSAVARAGRWVSRFCLVTLFVAAGFSIAGALAGIIGSSAVELLICAWYVGPQVLKTRGPVSAPIRQDGLLLFASWLCLNAYASMDLFALKLLGGTAPEVGVYGAAQNLSLLPALLAWTFASPLLATLSRLHADGDEAGAGALTRDALRITMWIVPVAAIVAGSSSDLVQLTFGAAFQSAGPLLAILLFGAVGNTVLVVAMTVMIAAGRPAMAVFFSAPLVPLAIAGHMVLTARWGAIGAAAVTCSVACLGAGAAVQGIQSRRRVRLPLGTLVRTIIIGGGAGSVSLLWHMTHALVFLEMVCLGLLSALALWATGEFRQGELAGMRAIFQPAPKSMGADGMPYVAAPVPRSFPER